MYALLCCLFGRPRWVTIDPTGSDPFMGGPTLMKVCRSCFHEHPRPTRSKNEA